MSGVSHHLAGVRPPAAVSSNSALGAVAQGGAKREVLQHRVEVLEQKRIELLEKTELLRRDEAEYRLREEAGTSQTRTLHVSRGAAALPNEGDMLATHTDSVLMIRVS